MVTNQDGILSKEELHNGLQTEFGIKLHMPELDALVAVFDEDGDGEVTLELQG